MKELKYHHSALQRGYHRKSNGKTRTKYEGRFGKGEIEHIPTVDSACSNKYHTIHYYIYEERINNQ